MISVLTGGYTTGGSANDAFYCLWVVCFVLGGLGNYIVILIIAFVFAWLTREKPPKGITQTPTAPAEPSSEDLAAERKDLLFTLEMLAYDLDECLDEGEKSRFRSGPAILYIRDSYRNNEDIKSFIRTWKSKLDYPSFDSAKARQQRGDD